MATIHPHDHNPLLIYPAVMILLPSNPGLGKVCFVGLDSGQIIVVGWIVAVNGVDYPEPMGKIEWQMG